MKKMVVVLAAAVLFGYWFKGFVQNGGLERYIDAHPGRASNPAVEYYWGMAMNIAGRQQSALHRLARVTEKYPKSEYAPVAWIEYIEIIDRSGDKKKVLEESKAFIASDYAEHPRAEIIKRRISVIEHGY